MNNIAPIQLDSQVCQNSKIGCLMSPADSFLTTRGRDVIAETPKQSEHSYTLLNMNYEEDLVIVFFPALLALSFVQCPCYAVCLG